MMIDQKKNLEVIEINKNATQKKVHLQKDIYREGMHTCRGDINQFQTHTKRRHTQTDNKLEEGTYTQTENDH